MGRADCCLAIADAVERMTGHDFAAPLRGYTNRFGAIRALLRNGHRSVASYLDAKLPRTARPRAGDVVALVGADGPLDPLLIADGRGGAWGQDEDGFKRFPLPANILAWSV